MEEKELKVKVIELASKDGLWHFAEFFRPSVNEPIIVYYEDVNTTKPRKNGYALAHCIIAKTDGEPMFVLHSSKLRAPVGYNIKVKAWMYRPTFIPDNNDSIPGVTDTKRKY